MSSRIQFKTCASCKTPNVPHRRDGKPYASHTRTKGHQTALHIIAAGEQIAIDGLAMFLGKMLAGVLRGLMKPSDPAKLPSPQEPKPHGQA